MQPPASSFECRLATAIQVALHDAQVERTGTRIVHFFDADVIAGSLFARSKIEETLKQQMPFTRSVVRALWLQGRLPRVRLTIPHLIELKHVLSEIQACGGIESYLRQRSEEISTEFGLASVARARERLIQLFKTLESTDADNEDSVATLVDGLGMDEFAIIEAELAASAFCEKRLLEHQIDLSMATWASPRGALPTRTIVLTKQRRSLTERGRDGTTQTNLTQRHSWRSRGFGHEIVVL